MQILSNMETKLCRKCGKVKPIAEFWSDAQKVDGKCWWCKDCMRQAYTYRNILKLQNRNVRLVKYSTVELLNELSYRLDLWKSGL